MNESDFEKALRALPPLAPRPELADRIEAELAKPAALHAPTLTSTPAAGTVARPANRSRWPGVFRALGWAGLGAAAVFAVILLTENQPASVPLASREAPTTQRVIAPENAAAAAVSELISADDDGLYLDSDSSEPQRQMRVTYLERYTWTNPETGAVIEFEVPREDIVLMPVAMQ